MAPNAHTRLQKQQSPVTTAGSTGYCGLPSSAGTFLGSLESRPQTSHSDGSKQPVAAASRRKQHAHSVSKCSFTRTVEKRLALDSMLSPALTDLRINRINLANEVRVHNGQVISSKIAGLRPRSRPAWPDNFASRLGRRGRHLQQSLIEYHKLKARELEGSLQLDPSMSFSWQDAKYTLDIDEHDWFETGSPGGKKKRNTVDAARDFMGKSSSGKNYGQGNTQQSLAATRENEVAVLMEDPRVVDVFETFKDDVYGGVPRKKVYRALQAISSSVYTATDELRGVVEDLMRTLKLGGHDDQQLTLQTFCLVIHAVQEIKRAYLHDRFTQLDTDGSGKISVVEFRHLAWDMGFTLSSSEMIQLFQECDTDHSGGLDQEEFARTAISMVDNFGFNKHQVQRFEELFDRYDQDRSGRLSPDELAAALGWFGTPTEKSLAEEMIAQCGEDPEGTLTRTEFLRTMRMRLEQELAVVRTQFAMSDDDLSGTLDFVEVSNLVFNSGYRLSSREALQDCIDKAQQHSTSRSEDGTLFFEDVVELIGLLRECEGFSERELKEFYEVFDRFNRHTGHMREFELEQAIHWLGYPVTPQQLRQLWCIADMDKTGTLERGEFLKIMRLLSEKEVDVAHEFVQDHSSQATFTEEAVADLLATLGYVMPHSVIIEAMEQAVPRNKAQSVELEACMSIIRQVREAQVQKRRQCHGVLDHIASKVRARFGGRRRIELGKSIEPAELEKLIVEIYPAAKHSPRELDAMHRICQDAKIDADGMDLDGAYKAISSFEEHRAEEQWKREQAIAEAAGFSPSKLAFFRTIFVSADTNHHGYLNGEEVLPLLDAEHFPEINATGITNMKETLSKLGTREECIEFVTFLEILALGYGPRCDSKLAARQAKAFLRTNKALAVNRAGSMVFGKKNSNKERAKSLLLPLKKPPRVKDIDEQSEPTPDETETVGPDAFGLTKWEWDAVQQLWCDPWPVGARLQKVICELRKCERDEIPMELSDDASNAISKGNFTFHQFAAWLAKNASDAQLEARLRPVRDRGRRGFDVNMIPNLGH
mmetsp:Transcript_35538/g.81410  ORF Transcript_35538/g.81410 Transcript_35538/m.81410 type:complete len:1048 (-) Transcript_35538:38-3181(-)